MLITAGYALFQAANNTAVMSGVSQNERGVVAGLLNLSRNLGLITGASAMGSVFALADRPEAGMHMTFALAAALLAGGLALSYQTRDPQHAATRE